MDGGLHPPKWERVGSFSPDMMCWEGHCTTVGFPCSLGLHLAIRKHQITQPGGHSRRYLTKALHKAQDCEKQGKTKELSLLRETKETRQLCDVGSWIRFWNRKRTLVESQCEIQTRSVV